MTATEKIAHNKLAVSQKNKKMEGKNSMKAIIRLRVISVFFVMIISVQSYAADQVDYNGNVLFQTDKTSTHLVSLQTINVRAYGAIGDGITNDTGAITNAFSFASKNKLGVIFDSNKTYMISNLSLAGTDNVPLFVDLNGSTLKAMTGTKGALVTIENPHLKVYGFWLGNGTINSNGQTDNALYIHGAQHIRLKNLKLLNSFSYNLKAYAEIGYGIYYNNYTDVFSTGGEGIYLGSNSTQGTSRFNANTLINIVSHYSSGDGITMEYANQNYLRAVVEHSRRHGINLMQVVYNLEVNGYVENHGLGGPGYYGLNLAANVWCVDFIGKLSSVSGGRFGGASLLNYGHQITIDNLASAQRWFSAVTASDGRFGLSEPGSGYPKVNMSPAFNGLKLGDGTANPWVSITMGGGSPEGVITAYKGSVYLRTDGGAGTTLYIKESGNGSRGWVAK